MLAWSGGRADSSEARCPRDLWDTGKPCSSSVRQQRFQSSWFTAATPLPLGSSSSLARPGGNLTGMTYFVPELMAKRIEMLKDISAAHQAGWPVLVKPDNPFFATARLERLRCRPSH